MKSRLHEKRVQISEPIDNKVDEMINEFGEISDRIDVVKSELENLSNRYKEIEGELRPLLELLHEQNTKSLQTNKYLIRLKRVGYNRENYKYKESFEQSLTKVNEQTRKVLEGILQQTKTVTRVVSTIGVQKINEISLKSMLQKLVSPFKKFVSGLKKNNKRLDMFNLFVKKML